MLKVDIFTLRWSANPPYFPSHYDLKCSVFECAGHFCSMRTGLTLNLLMSADVCEDSSCTGNLLAYEREETWIKRNEESNLTNDLCQLSTLARMTSGKRQLSHHYRALFLTPHYRIMVMVLQPRQCFPLSHDKATGKNGTETFVTKLMRLHYHLGFYAYVTPFFMVSLRLLIACGTLSQGQLSCASP